jgi:hypothetical protein
MDDLVEQGINAFRGGNRDEARKLFLAAVKQNPNNERAWGWLSNTTNNDKERVDCLKQVLRINPNNEQVNQLLKSMTGYQSHLEHQQPQNSKQFNQQNPIPIQSNQKQPLINSKSVKPKNRQGLLIPAGIFVLLVFCICGSLFLGQFLGKLNAGTQPAAQVLSAQDVFNVSAVEVVETKGYTLTSAVCEVVSPEHFNPIINSNGTPISIDLFQIIFHAFRITGPGLNSELVVLFASNHTAAKGQGQVFAINADAKRLFPEYPDGSKLSYPITTDTLGSQSALLCAQQAGKPPTLQLNNFDVEAWRREAIQKFGPEKTYSDGSKDDYVKLALSICKYKAADPSVTYDDGSLQQYIIDTFCPHVNSP